MKRRETINLLAVLFGTLAINPTYALTYSIPSDGEVIGGYQKIRMNGKETLFDVAKRYDIGVQEMLAHNRGMRLYSRGRKGATVTIPAQFKLPSGPREGIVLNINQRRLYYFRPGGEEVVTYPVGVGRSGWSTPKGETTVVAKRANPSWTPPPSIRREAARRGRQLPKVVPAGPRNPLGRYAINLGISGILIHGTNQQTSVGVRCSHGCIRMYSHNIKALFNEVTIGTPVRIINE